VTGLDFVIIGFTVLFAIYGYTRGFIAGILSLVGFVVGVLVGTRLIAAILPDGLYSPYAPLLALLGALLAGLALFSGLSDIGQWFHRLLRFRFLQLVDCLCGALLTAGVVLSIFWMLGVVALQTPGVDKWRNAIQQ